MAESSVRVAGCDLGKASVSFAVLTIGGDPGARAVRIESVETVAHEGRPMEVFAGWYEREAIASCDALAATGLHADELTQPVISGLPEDACLSLAIDSLPELAGPLNLVSVGARGYSVLTRDVTGRVQFVENDKCSSGTGETFVRIAGRFGLTIAEADELAQRATETIPITARCSVFAKSEMTHFGNQGRPADALFRGYFGSVANYVAALVARARVDGPVFVAGGCARIATLVDALGESLGTPVVVPEQFLHLEAIGAAVLAGDQALSETLDRLPAKPSGLVQRTENRFTVLDPAGRSRGRVKRLTDRVQPESAANEPSVLGFDLGSTGSKAVVTSIRTGEIVLDVYDRTQGNPVDALQRLVRALTDRAALDVRAVSLTGSGREAAATVVRAAFPGAGDRILTLNEIVAHATAAIRCDEQGGRSMSVVEIGGQDAKFIQVRDGKIVESGMNKACSAGTGSFLEEQALFYGVDDISDFTRLASEAQGPPDLGQMCTVFVAEAAGDAHNEGFALPELFAGFQYSVIHNYINRVMGQRTFGDRIFFQGKPASGESLAWTLAAVTGREVVVPANPGAMGAWGIGLCALDELGTQALLDAPPLELARVLDAEVLARKEFQCRDVRCATLCNIERTRVAVGGEEQTVLSGGACPKYEVASGTKAKLAIDAPSAFDERLALLEPFIGADGQDGDDAGDEARDDQDPIGIPMAGTSYAYMPWLVTFVRELGLPVKVLLPDADSLWRGEERCYSYDACAPVKSAHGVLDAGVGRVFFPKFLSTDSESGGCGTTCAMEQAKPAMVREALAARGTRIEVISPALRFEDGTDSSDLVSALVDVAGELCGAPVEPSVVEAAVLVAAMAQAIYEAGLASIGMRTLEYGREHQIPVVPVLGHLHVIHDPVVNASIPKLLRENGVLPLPMDCFSVPESIHRVPRAPWSDARYALRAGIACRERGDAYPVLLSSFGCNPASFNEQIFGAVMDGHPHTTLESDGHGGTAGYTTRVQAFLHAVTRHDGRSTAVPGERLRYLEPLVNEPVSRDDDTQYLLPAVGDQFGAVMAANWRSYGLDAVTAGPPDADKLRVGRRDCSGKECLPYQLLWGSFRTHLEANDDGRDRVLVQATGTGMCRNCMFSVKDQISLERLDVTGDVSVRDLQSELSLGWSFLPRAAIGVCVTDILLQLAAYHRPLESWPGQVDDMYWSFARELEAITEAPATGSGIFDRIVANTPVGGLRDTRRYARAVNDLVDRASVAFAEIAERADHDPQRRTVMLAGDIVLKIDEFANDDIVRRLNSRGMQVAIEPSQALLEYISLECPGELVRTTAPDDKARGLVARGQQHLRRKLYDRVAKWHPWIPRGEATTFLEHSRPVLGRYPRGEAPVTIGSVLQYWREGLCDGVVVVSPWGCGPALVSESILRHQPDIPIVFFYHDGSPIDERRLNAFAFRLRRDPPRTAASDRTTTRLPQGAA